MTLRDSQSVTEVTFQRDMKPAYALEITGLDRKWSWPVGDSDLKAIIFKRLPDLTEAVSYCRAKRTAIQAGAAMGVWAHALATQHGFNRVVAFESNRALRPFLDFNLRDTPGVETHSLGLSDDCGPAVTVTRLGNIGATWMKPVADGDCYMSTLDAMISKDEPVDLIQLDVEGYEYKALLGAKRLISLHRPVCMIEETGLGTRYFGEAPDAAQRLLEGWGYQLVKKVHRDLILVPSL